MVNTLLDIDAVYPDNTGLAFRSTDFDIAAAADGVATHKVRHTADIAVVHNRYPVQRSIVDLCDNYYLPQKQYMHYDKPVER